VQFALNYSPQAADLLRAGTITIDRFKCPDWPDLIQQAAALRPVYVHFPLIAGQRNLERVGLDHVENLRSQTATPFVNTHIAPRLQDLADPNDPAVIIDAALRDILPLVARFGPEQVIAENVPVPDIPPDKPLLAADPAVIRQVIETSGCGLLLDLGHARLAAETLGLPVRAYIEQLPVERLRELHITGVGLNRQGQREDHLAMSDADWALLEWALEQIRSGRWARPLLAACEYGGIGPMFDWRTEPAVIAHDIPRMAALIQAAVS
jgi:uncharacterized protein (UPF0276 family)